MAAAEPVPNEPVASLRRYHGLPAAHEHAFAQVLLGLHGRLELEVGGRRAWVDAENGLVVPAGTRHQFHAPQPAQVWVIDSPVQPALARVRRFALAPGWHRADTAALLAHVAGAPRALQRRPLAPAQIEAAVDAALHEAWPTARLAALAHLSPQRFHARWLALTGLAPQAWLRARRLDAAARLLRAGVPLETAALRVGYARASALSAALRRERDLGARALRRR